MRRLIVLMPCKNEAEKYLKQVLQHCLSFTPDVFVYDDQSTDESTSLAFEVGATVMVRPDSVPGFVEHEGAFRQGSWEAMERVMKPAIGDWIFSIDADEILSGVKILPELMANPYYQVMGVKFFHMWTPTQYRTDKAWAPTIGSRMYLYYPNGQYKQSKLACGAEPTYVLGLIQARRILWESGLRMKHLSYIEDHHKEAKYERYSTLDGGDYHAKTHIESITDKDVVLAPWED